MMRQSNAETGSFPETILGNLLTAVRLHKRPLLIILLLSVLYILIFRALHDHVAYQKQWTHILNGTDSYHPKAGNAYGPLHNALAYVMAVSNRLPRLLFALSTLAATVFLLGRVELNTSLPDQIKRNLKRYLYYNPLFWVFVIVFGSNDGLLAGLFLFGIVAFHREHFVKSALLLALATLLKFIPIFVIPFLGVSRKGINWKFGLWYTLFLAIGFGLGYLAWGMDVFKPLFFNSGRESKMLSVFMFLRGKFSPLHWFGTEGIDHLSMPFLIGSILVLFALHLIFHFDSVFSAILALSLVLMFYLVGHHQFYLSLVFLLIFLVTLRYGSFEAFDASVYRYLWYFLLWIAFVTALYAATEGYYRHFAIIRDIVGLPTFAFHLLMNIHLIRYGIQRRERFDLKTTAYVG